MRSEHSPLRTTAVAVIRGRRFHLQFVWPKKLKNEGVKAHLIHKKQTNRTCEVRAQRLKNYGGGRDKVVTVFIYSSNT